MSRSSWTVSSPPSHLLHRTAQTGPPPPTFIQSQENWGETMGPWSPWPSQAPVSSPSAQISLSLSLALSILYSVVRTVKCVFFCQNEDVFSQSWNSPPELLRQHFHGDATTLRTLANAVAELTFLLLLKNAVELDGLKHTWADGTENTSYPSLFPLFLTMKAFRSGVQDTDRKSLWDLQHSTPFSNRAAG